MSHENQEQSEIPNTPTAEETPAISPETPVEAPASDTPSTTPAEPLESGRRVTDMSDYNKLLEAAQAPAPIVPEGTTEAPAGETPAETTEATTDETTPDPEDQTPAENEEPQTRKEFRPRLSSLDARAQEAILLAKELKEQGKEISLGEAERRVNAKYGITGSETQPQDQTPPAPVRTVADIDAEIAAKEAEAEKHADELDMKTARKLDREITALELEKLQLRSAQETEAKNRLSQEGQAFKQQVEQSRQKTTEIYPVAADKNHAIHAKATEIWNAMEASENPLIFDANAPLRVYQMAANELGIAPGSTKSPSKSPVSVTPKPQSVQQTAARRPNQQSPVASPGDRTTQPGTTPEQPVSFKNAHEYEQFVRKQTGSRL